MPRPKREGPPGYEPAVQFRPVPPLARLVRSFADGHGLALNESYKDLAALAVVGLDVRYFDLVNQLAQAMGGSNAFAHACLQIYEAIHVAALAGQPLTSEPARSIFVLKVVKDFVERHQRQLPALDLWFLPRESQPAEETDPRKKTFTGRKRRTIRMQVAGEEPGPTGEAAGQGSEADERARTRP